MSPARFRWGLLLIFFGVLFLLINMGTLNHNIWGDLLYFSPFLLIAIGIEKIFTRSRLELISYASSVLLVGGGLFLAFNSGYGGKEADFFSDAQGRIESTGDVQTLNAVVHLDEEDLTVSDYTDDLAEWSVEKFTRKPQVDFNKGDGNATISFDNKKGGMWGRVIHIDPDGDNIWYLAFSREIPLFLDCTGDRSDVHLDFSETPLRRLKVDIADGRIYVVIGKSEPNVELEASGVDTKLRLRVPNDAGLRIRGIDDPDYLRTIGLVESGGDFVTEGYDTMTNKINVKLDDRFNSLTLEFY
jgi:hypothetical protein